MRLRRDDLASHREHIPTFMYPSSLGRRSLSLEDDLAKTSAADSYVESSWGPPLMGGSVREPAGQIPSAANIPTS
jgi:hypothetical protein